MSVVAGAYINFLFINFYKGTRRMFQRDLFPKVALVSSLLLMGTLAGCGSLDNMDAEEYRQKCLKLGIQPNSPHFDQCMLQQQSLDEDQEQRFLDRMERGEEARSRRR